MPEVIGVYDHPPPEGQETIRATQVADIGAVPLVRAVTRLRDRIAEAAGDLLG